jgi:hypothetical protein
MRFYPVVAAASLVFASSPAWATPRNLPFTYNYETNPEGEGEIETYVDLVPVKAIDPNTLARRSVLLSQFQEEFEYGITNRLELGLYVTFAVPPQGFTGEPYVPTLTEGNGSKQRLRYRFSDPGKLPIDIGIYGEVTENENEVELEAKLILQRRFGNFAIAANLVGEHEFYLTGQSDWILDPSAGFWYQVTPVFQPAFEWWMYKEWSNQAPDGSTFNLKDQQYVGPAVLRNLGRVWWTTGAYLRVSNFNHVMDPTNLDTFGPAWFRTVIGVTL